MLGPTERPPTTTQRFRSSGKKDGPTVLLLVLPVLPAVGNWAFLEAEGEDGGELEGEVEAEAEGESLLRPLGERGQEAVEEEPGPPGVRPRRQGGM